MMYVKAQQKCKLVMISSGKLGRGGVPQSMGFLNSFSLGFSDHALFGGKTKPPER